LSAPSTDAHVYAHLGMEIGRKVKFRAGGVSHSCDVQAIYRERRDEDLVIHHRLGWKCGIIHNPGLNVGRLRGGPPIEVKGDENLHAFVGGRLVGIAELLVGVWIHADVERECVNTMLSARVLSSS
jgi:hypothetical protein